MQLCQQSDRTTGPRSRGQGLDAAYERESACSPPLPRSISTPTLNVLQIARPCRCSRHATLDVPAWTEPQEGSHPTETSVGYYWAQPPHETNQHLMTLGPTGPGSVPIVGRPKSFTLLASNTPRVEPTSDTHTRQVNHKQQTTATPRAIQGGAKNDHLLITWVGGHTTYLLATSYVTANW